MATRIVYVSWSAKEISGGIKMAFRHVEALRDLGMEAAIATPDGIRPAWFRTGLEVLRLSELRRGDDILVLPENNQSFLREFAAWPNRKVIFFQGLMLGVRGLGDRQCYSDYGVSDLICVGHQAADYCQLRFPRLNLAIIPVVIDTERFRPSSEKILEIAFLPRKRPVEATFIRDLFKSLDAGRSGVRFVEINGATEEQLSGILSRSAIFLSLSRLETCPLTPLEAMACGCVCVGFTGGGGRDYATAQNGFWVEEDACVPCVHELRRAVEVVRSQGDQYREVLRASLETANRYGRKLLLQRLDAFWRPFVSQALAG